MSGEVEFGTKTASLNCTNPRAFQMPLFLLGHKPLKQLWNRCTNNYFTLSPAVPLPVIYLSQLQLTQCQLHGSPCRASQGELMLVPRHTEEIPAAF